MCVSCDKGRVEQKNSTHAKILGPPSTETLVLHARAREWLTGADCGWMAILGNS